MSVVAMTPTSLVLPFDDGQAVKAVAVEQSLHFTEGEVRSYPQHISRDDVAHFHRVEQVDLPPATHSDAHFGQLHGVGALGMGPIAEDGGDRGDDDQRQDQAVVTGGLEDDEDGGERGAGHGGEARGHAHQGESTRGDRRDRDCNN